MTGIHRRAIRRWASGLVLAGVTLVTSGFTSCAGATGPLFAPLSITPSEVLLRASVSRGTHEALALARIDGGEEGDRYAVEVSYIKDPATAWLTIDIGGTDLTLRALADGLDPGTYFAEVTFQSLATEASALLRVEFNVLP